MDATHSAEALRDRAEPCRDAGTRVPRTGTVDVDGLAMYHEIHGDGPPLVQLALDRPELVRRVVWYGGINFDPAGLHSEMLADLGTVTVEQVAGTPWHDAYLAVAPDPAGWPRLVARIAELDRTYTGWDPARLRAISAPTLLIAGDADLSRPEHVVEMFRLFGGGVLGDLHPLPAAQLGILPGASHVGVLAQTAVLRAMILPFLAADPPARTGTG